MAASGVPLRLAAEARRVRREVVIVERPKGVLVIVGTVAELDEDECAMFDMLARGTVVTPADFIARGTPRGIGNPNYPSRLDLLRRKLQATPFHIKQIKQWKFDPRFWRRKVIGWRLAPWPHRFRVRALSKEH